MTTILDTALANLDRGWISVPACTSPCDIPHHQVDEKGNPIECPGKRPMVKGVGNNGLTTVTAEQIRRWWGEYSDSQLAVLTGFRSNLVVVDVDGPEGEAMLARLVELYGPLPPTLEVRTKRGRHLYFRHPGEGVHILTRRGGVFWPEGKEQPSAKGFDVRGDGGLVIAPPSQNREFVNDLEPVELPAGWVEPLSTSMTSYADLDDEELNKALAEIRTEGTPCPCMEKALAKHDGHYPTMRDAQFNIVQLGREGHPGAGEALDRLDALDQSDDRDWSRALRGAVEAAMAGEPEQTDCPAKMKLKKVTRKKIEETTMTETKIEEKEGAQEKPKEKAKKEKPARPWFTANGAFLVEDFAKALVKANPMALTLDQRIAVYENGVYRPDDMKVMGTIVMNLGNDYRSSYHTTVTQVIKGRLAISHFDLPERMDRPWVNVQNGWVELETGELHDHDPNLVTAVQLPIEYDPEATCPTFDAWLKEVAGDQAQALLEASSEMLDLSRTPHKALFLYGPSRSGKSTFLRLLEAVAGKENTSAVTLHSLADDKFAAARVHGKILNIASDLSAGHIEDLSIFKMLTGEDPIDANPKYGKPFKFYNQALMGFSANEIPSVGESSRAYFERMLAFKFDYSFAGHEDQTIEDRMMDELPGIFNRLVQAWQARRKRGEALNANPTVQREFEAGSDRVQQWLDEEMESLTEWDGKPVTEGMQLPAEAFDETSDAKSLRILFNAWARENGVGEMGGTP